MVAAAVAADQDPANYHPQPMVVTPPPRSVLPHAPFVPHFSPASYESINTGSQTLDHGGHFQNVSAPRFALVGRNLT